MAGGWGIVNNHPRFIKPAYDHNLLCRALHGLGYLWGSVDPRGFGWIWGKFQQTADWIWARLK